MNGTLEAIDTHSESLKADRVVRRELPETQIDIQPAAAPTGTHWNQWLKSFAVWRQTLSKLGEGKMGEESR